MINRSRSAQRISPPNSSLPQNVLPIPCISPLIVALSIGQVIRAPDFSFLDSLGALEIMDPKTDSGMILSEEDAKEFTPESSLLPEEIIWIMDQLLAREVYP